MLRCPQAAQDQIGFKYLIPTYRDRILSWGGKTYGYPYDGDAHKMYYRRDLLTDPTQMADFKAKYGYDLPAPPKTWKQYHDIAEFFNGKTIDGQTIYGAGTAFKPQRPVLLDLPGHRRLLLPRRRVTRPISSIPIPWSHASTTPAFVEALDLYTSLVKLGPPDVVNWDVGDIRSNFPAGKAGPGDRLGRRGSALCRPEVSAIIGKWGSVLEPGVDQY